MSLFDVHVSDTHVGYRNIKDAQNQAEQAIRQGLDELWARYEPYADTNFRTEFARQPDARFWEMYLTVVLLDAGKKIQPREKLHKAERGAGPDICIPKGRRKIWIEAIAPDRGELDNLDRVPDLFAASAKGSCGSRAPFLRSGMCLKHTGRATSWPIRIHASLRYRRGSSPFRPSTLVCRRP
jgi:hypothetical protein